MDSPRFDPIRQRFAIVTRSKARRIVYWHTRTLECLKKAAVVSDEVEHDMKGRIEDILRGIGVYISVFTNSPNVTS